MIPAPPSLPTGRHLSGWFKYGLVILTIAVMFGVLTVSDAAHYISAVVGFAIDFVKVFFNIIGAAISDARQHHTSIPTPTPTHTPR